MSKLTKFFRRHVRAGIIRQVVQYLEDVQIPGAAKKALAMAIIKKLHIDTGGQWDEQIERAVDAAIEWVLAEIREFAASYGQVSVANVTSSVTDAPSGE